MLYIIKISGCLASLVNVSLYLNGFAALVNPFISTDNPHPHCRQPIGLIDLDGFASLGAAEAIISLLVNKLASLEAMLVRNYDPASYSLTGVRCRATSVVKTHHASPLQLLFISPPPE